MLRFILFITLAGLGFAADDPFIGKWELSLVKSKLAGQTIEIQEVAENSYQFQEDEHTDVIFADGLDHLTHFGDSMAITKKSANIWEITYKRGSQVTMNTVWKIASDDKTLTYTATGTRPNGQHFHNQMTLERIGGASGFEGTWRTTTVELSSPRQIYIAPYDTGGHLVTFPGRQQTVRMKFDGKEYPDIGPTVVAGFTSSGRRIDANTIETTEKIKGKTVETAKATVSADGVTQTIVVTEPGDPTAVVLVYEREK